MHKTIVIVGPTASGKSSLAVRLAKKFGGEIISADSRQIYKGLDIGTGKITRRDMHGVKHHLLDVVSPKKIFSASDFVRLAGKAYSSVLQNTRIAIIAGGTGFYIDTLLGRASLAAAPANPKLREKLSKESVGVLFSKLQVKDAMRARSMNSSDRRNPMRLIRALEIAAQQSHKKVLVQMPPEKLDFGETLWIGLKPDKAELRKKIHARLLSRMKQGMVAEAKKLHEAGLSWKRMHELGLEYRYLALYLQGKLSKKEMLRQLETKIWQYAKRQMTYWRRNKEIKWFESARTAESWLKNNF